MKTLKFINLILILSIVLLSSINFGMYVNATTSDMYETESNNSYSTADTTYDDYNNYGSLTNGDVDWWKITFDEEGFANFYLSDIPTGCDYKLYVYPGSIYSDSVAFSNKSGNADEWVKCHVIPDVVYYIRVSRASGYSSAQYKLRMKNYVYYNGARIFTTYYDYEDDGGNPHTYDTRDADLCSTYIRNMGLTATTGLVNISASAKYQSMPSAHVNVYASHGYCGCMFTTSSLSSAVSHKAHYSFPDGSYAMENYSFNQLSGVYLNIFGTCYSGGTDPDYGNLVDITLSKGGLNAVGWTQAINTVDTNTWINKFFNYLSDGLSVGNALNATTAYFDDVDGFDRVLIDCVYTGNSPLYNLVLGPAQ